MTEYSSHDWRKNTDDAVVVGDVSGDTRFKSQCIVELYFTNIQRRLKGVDS